MAVPKTKTSNARRDKRRSSVWKLDAPAMAKCPNCGEQFECELGCDGNCDGCSGCDDADEE